MEDSPSRAALENRKLMDAYALMKAREAQRVAADWKAYAARVEKVLHGTEANYQARYDGIEGRGS